MRVTTKGQVTIPQNIREKMGITPASEVEFIEENGRVYLLKKEPVKGAETKFKSLRGIIAPAKMTTDEIMALTRDIK